MGTYIAVLFPDTVAAENMIAFYAYFVPFSVWAATVIATAALPHHSFEKSVIVIFADNKTANLKNSGRDVRGELPSAKP
jgi:hypothetical protein